MYNYRSKKYVNLVGKYSAVCTDDCSCVFCSDLYSCTMMVRKRDRTESPSASHLQSATMKTSRQVHSRMLHSICLHPFFPAFELHINHFCSSSSFSFRNSIFWFLDLHWA